MASTPVVLTTQPRLRESVARTIERSSQLAESIAIADPDSVVRTVVVILNLELLDREGRPVTPDAAFAPAGRRVDALPGSAHLAVSGTSPRLAA